MKQIFLFLKTKAWGYVNTLQDIETDEYYAPGRVFPSANKERVIVPRDIYQANIRAIKITLKAQCIITR